MRESIRRIGQTFAANLNRPALLQLAPKTSMDALHADSGRLSARDKMDEPLAETMRVGALSAFRFPGSRSASTTPDARPWPTAGWGSHPRRT